MKNNFPNLGQCLSILDRLMKMYYDRGLSSNDITVTEQTLEQMMENINHKVWHRMEE